MTGASPSAAVGRIGQALSQAREENRAALVLYLMAGDPDLATTAALIRTCQDLGVDVVELGIPFSDPVADGPVIQAAGVRALRHGITLRQILAFVKSLREDGITLPLVGMGYTNPMLAMGFESFAETAVASGLDGIIVPDLPPDEGEALLAVCGKVGLDWIQLAAPTTRPERLRYLAQTSRGFLYYVSRTGITGAQASLPQELAAELDAVRAECPLPVAVGFGISTPEQAGLVGRHADGVVIGSALVRLIAESTDRETCLAQVGDFIKPIKRALARQEP